MRLRNEKKSLLFFHYIWLSLYLHRNSKNGKMYFDKCNVVCLVGVICLFVASPLHAQQSDSLWKGLVHGVEVNVRPEYVFQTNPFLQGDNMKGKPVRGAFSAHLKYRFRYRPGSLLDRIYGGVYQGVGIGRYTFGESEQIGTPLALYLFQGARIATVAPGLSFNYEWNFGLSTGWVTYMENSYNKMMGSKMNAYINAGFYFNWLLTPQLNVNAGVTLSHFSNGNTNIPNAGLNTIGLKLGLAYTFCDRAMGEDLRNPKRGEVPDFRRHVTYDVVFFGSWRRRGFDIGDGQYPSPEAYPVFGFQFSPMYNLGYKLRLGVSLDGVYDGSANVRLGENADGYNIRPSDIIDPELYQQLALGISGRIEYVMPFFTVGIGFGGNFLGYGEFKVFYQMLALKIALSREIFVHVGYNLQEFRTPSFLMLGVGFRFNNKP